MNENKKRLTITIVASGPYGTGKTLATDIMVAALKDKFDIVAQYPAQRELGGVETYTFVARLRR